MFDVAGANVVSPILFVEGLLEGRGLLPSVVQVRMHILLMTRSSPFCRDSQDPCLPFTTLSLVRQCTGTYTRLSMAEAIRVWQTCPHWFVLVTGCSLLAGLWHPHPQVQRTYVPVF